MLICEAIFLFGQIVAGKARLRPHLTVCRAALIDDEAQWLSLILRPYVLSPPRKIFSYNGTLGTIAKTLSLL